MPNLQDFDRPVGVFFGAARDCLVKKRNHFFFAHSDFDLPQLLVEFCSLRSSATCQKHHTQQKGERSHGLFLGVYLFKSTR